MDNATHAFAGLLLADATTAWIERRTGSPAGRRLRRAVVALGLVAAELPDADLLYSGPLVGMGKLGYLLHHRGHTHTLLFAVVAALLLWWVTMAIRRRASGGLDAHERIPLLVLAMAGTLSHVLLDFTNSYGVHPFWPIDNRWIYGDAVFIVEPWLWVAAIPPLLFGPRRIWGRVLLSLLLCLILVASWTLGELTQALALTVTICAAMWLVAQRWIPARRRVLAGLVTWGAVEAVFTVSGAQARTHAQGAALVAMSPGERIVDVVLSPGAANPFLYHALVVSLTPDTYLVRSATVALPAGGDARVTWGDQWSAPRAELIALAASRCEMDFALRFMRVPVWERGRDGAVLLSDLRFGAGGNGFSDLRIAAGPCPLPKRAWIPPWTPPRADALEPLPIGN